MFVLGSEDVLEDPCALQVVVGDDLPGESHASVDLDAAPRVPDRAFSCSQLGRGDGAFDVGHFGGVEGCACIVSPRAGRFLSDEHLRQDVFHRLESADRPAELLSTLRIRVCEIECALGQTELLARYDGRTFESHTGRRVSVADLLALGQGVDVVHRCERIEGNFGLRGDETVWIESLDAVRANNQQDVEAFEMLDDDGHRMAAAKIDAAYHSLAACSAVDEPCREVAPHQRTGNEAPAELFENHHSVRIAQSDPRLGFG